MNFCGHAVDIQDSDSALASAALREQGRARVFVPFAELLPLLVDPMGKQPLIHEGAALRGTERTFPLVAGCPLLFPCDMARVDAVLRAPDALERFSTLSPLEQYCAFGMLKGSNNGNNLDHEDPWYGRHLWRSVRLLREVSGSFLDVGCDDAFLSRGLLPEDVRYVGLDPAPTGGAAFRVGGFGEFLPFRDASFDAVGFQTSLDHIFDYHLALAEARRVLRPGGRLYLATLLWTASAQLYTDTVHFHHFRAGQMETALREDFDVDHVQAYSWKGNTHRFGVYLSARRK